MLILNDQQLLMPGCDEEPDDNDLDWISQCMKEYALKTDHYEKWANKNEE